MANAKVMANLNNSTLMFVLDTRQGFVARKGFRKYVRPMKDENGNSKFGQFSSFERDMTASNGVAPQREVANLALAAHTMKQVLDKDEACMVTLALPEDAAIRFYEARGCFKSGMSIEQTYAKLIGGKKTAWITDDYKEALKDVARQFGRAYASENIDFNIMKSSNISSWKVMGDGLADGAEIELHTVTKTDGSIVSQTEDGSVVCENARVAGKFTVHDTGYDSQNKGEHVERFVIDRAGNSANLRTLKKLDELVRDALPKEVSLDDMDESMLDMAANGEF